MRSIHRVLVLLGASYHDLELTRLQALAAGAEQLADRIAIRLDAAQPGPIEGVVVLATCNRVEMYLDVRLFHDGVDTVTANPRRGDRSEPRRAISATLEVRVGAPVAAHLFAVAAGLDSMVVGEVEIAGQVSRALGAAQLAGTVSPTLNLLFQRASRTARQVQSRTDLGTAGRSVASVALDVAESADGPLATKTVLIIGTGAYARVALAALRARGCTDVSVFSTGDRAAGFAERHDARPVSADELATVIKSVDLIVACSGHRGAVITGELLDVSGRDRPLTIVDLALQHDVDDDVRIRPSVRIVDLLTVAQHAPGGESGAIAAAQDLVIAAVADFEDTQAVRVVDPAVIALRTHISGVVQKEMERLRGKFDESVAAELELAMHRVTRSMLHTPTMRAQELARTGDAAGYIAALHTLFGIDLSSSPRPWTADRAPRSGAVGGHWQDDAVSVVLISGDEPLLVDRAVSAAVSRRSAHDPDIERRESTAGELTVGSFSDLVAPSLFAEPRVVVIRQAHEAAKELAAALIDYLGDPVDGVTLVVQHGGGARNKALAEACLTAGAKPVQCSRITRPAERIDFVRAEIAAAGGTTTAEAVAALVDAVGTDLRELAGAAGQLVADTGGIVDESAVRRYHRGRADVSGFTVADRVVAGDVPGALEAPAGPPTSGCRRCWSPMRWPTVSARSRRCPARGAAATPTSWRAGSACRRGRSRRPSGRPGVGPCRVLGRRWRSRPG